MAANDPKLCSISGFEASGVLTNDGVQELLRRLPGDHPCSPALRSLTYVDEVRHESNPRRHRRFPREQILGEWSINSETGYGDANIYRQHEDGNPNHFDFLRTILHEVGHSVHETLLDPDKVEWATIHAQSDVLINEQSRVADEHFCHLYAAYVLKPDYVRAGFAMHYDFLRDRVFRGKEYS